MVDCRIAVGVLQDELFHLRDRIDRIDMVGKAICRNCEQVIYWKEIDGKNVPHDDAEGKKKHDCPKSQYGKKTRSFAEYRLPLWNEKLGVIEFTDIEELKPLYPNIFRVPDATTRFAYQDRTGKFIDVRVASGATAELAREGKTLPATIADNELQKLYEHLVQSPDGSYMFSTDTYHSITNFVMNDNNEVDRCIWLSKLGDKGIQAKITMQSTFIKRAKELKAI